jgi:hypothetical protein
VGRWTWIDRLANIAILALAIVVGIVAWRQYVARAPHDINVPVGSLVNLENVDWPKNQLTIVLALSTECEPCSRNAVLYRDIANALRTNQVGKTVAVLPQQVSRSREYLSELKVVPDEIRQRAASPFVAKATPTIIAVGADGRVVKSWAGSLSQREAESALREITTIVTHIKSSMPCVSCGAS